jgi:glycosyltransferase involved in cell wall biosynthesis
MKVIFDISVLGKGFYIPRARTGIFRVIENLSHELIKARVISSYSFGLRIGNYLECLDYLQSNPALNDAPMIKPNVGEKLMKIFQYLHRYKNIETSVPLYMKLVSGFVNGISNKIFSFNLLNDDILAVSDIYHSPLHPFPGQVKRIKKLKKVITIYDLVPVLYPEFFDNNGKGFMQRILKSIGDDVWVTCISHSTKNDLCNYLPSLDQSRVFVTHLAASSLFCPCYDQVKIEAVKAKFGIPEGPYILSLSTLEPRKNIIQTIKCYNRIVTDGALHDLSLVLVGPKGWDFDSIFNEIEVNPNIRSRIKVTGYIPDEFLSPLYSGAMMFVYLSLYEGFGLPPLEAMQCGVPVITSNTSSLPEVVGEAGIMVNPGDGDSVCQAMLNIYKSIEYRQKLSSYSLSQASKFSWKKCAEQTIEAYKAALSDK